MSARRGVMLYPQWALDADTGEPRDDVRALVDERSAAANAYAFDVIVEAARRLGVSDVALYGAIVDVLRDELDVLKSREG